MEKLAGQNETMVGAEDRSCMQPDALHDDIPHEDGPVSGKLVESHRLSVDDAIAAIEPFRRKRRPNDLGRYEVKYQPEATEFSDDADMASVLWLVRSLRAHPQFLAPARAVYERAPRPDPVGDAVKPRKKPGPERMDGDWLLAYLAWTASRDPAIQSFCNRWSDVGIWEECGFAHAPDYNTVWLRFVEMEKIDAARREEGLPRGFTLASQALIRHARKHEKRIGEFLLGDGTAYHAHARLEHCCPSDKPCMQKTSRKARRFLAAATEEEVREARAAEAQTPGPIDEELLVPNNALTPLEEDKRYRYFEYDGHRYRTRDKTAGVRSYTRPDGTKKKTWLGGLVCSLADTFTGAPVAVEAMEASESEHHVHPELLKGAVEALGETPLGVALDAGGSVKSVFRLHTTLGILSATPWRPWGRPDMERDDCRTDLYDEHGIPRCQHCGGPADVDGAGMGWLSKRGKPYLRYRCILRHTPECAKPRTIACETEWRLLLPVSRVSSLYHTLRNAQQNHEKNHAAWRNRYAVAGNDLSGRLKRTGLHAQQLHADAGLVIEWFRICVRHGWLGSHRRLNRCGLSTKLVGRSLRATLKARRARGLNLPYGPAAVRLKLAPGGPAPPGLVASTT